MPGGTAAAEAPRPAARRRRDARPFGRVPRVKCTAFGCLLQRWQVSWLTDLAPPFLGGWRPRCSPTFPGIWPSGMRRTAHRLQLRGQPRHRTAFPINPPSGNAGWRDHHGCSMAGGLPCQSGALPGRISVWGLASDSLRKLAGGLIPGIMGNARLVPTHLTTARLLLRPTDALDAGRAFDIQSDWSVTRMLRTARFPPDRLEIQRWFADHPREWHQGEAYRFSVEREGKLIGLVDIDEINAAWGDLGYWFAATAWGQGYASEAAQAVVRFAFEKVGLLGLRSGHAGDNAASRNILLKLGFCEVDTVRVKSRSREENIIQYRYALHRPPDN